MRHRIVPLVLFVLVAYAAFFVGPVQAAEYSTPAAMMDAEILDPHQSEITGEMVQNAWRWYGIPTNVFLAVAGAETSMGDPRYGGRLITEGHHNYGCLRYGVGGPKVSELACGVATVAGKDWYSFPTMTAGVMALGRYLKIGPTHNPGYYLRCFKQGDWFADFAAVYYGRSVPGYWQYVANLRAIYDRVTRIAREHGFAW